jgi:predicted HTH transcriptional regulator
MKTRPLNELAKQLSAFANVGGGRIIYGLKNDGSIDGGVSTTMKKGGLPRGSTPR